MTPLCLSALLSESVRADYLSFPQAHAAEFESLPKWFVDAGVSVQDNYHTKGVRIQYKAKSDILLYAHAGLSEQNLAAGAPVGIGASYSFGTFKSRVNAAVSVSISAAQYEVDDVTLDASSATVNLIISRLIEPDSVRLRNWYMNAGLRTRQQERKLATRIVSSEDVDTVIGMGIMYPFLIIGENQRGNIYGGEVFTGFEYSNQFEFSFGLRYYLR